MKMTQGAEAPAGNGEQYQSDAVGLRAGTAISAMDKEEVISFEALYESMLKCKCGVLWKASTASFFLNGIERCLQLEKELRSQIFPGQVLRTKEGEVVTEEQIRAYEKAMREKGVGTGSAPTDAAPPAQEAKAPASAAKAEAASSAPSKTASKKAAEKAVPEELF